MVFGTVMKTIQQFEHPQILGREVRWAFDGPQLLVVPRAGRWRNAFYQRESHSLQFFFFDHHGTEVFLSLSEDIVAHETGHAVLDGIAPDLFDAVTPQALAIHESVADLTALTRAMRNKALVDEVLRKPDWTISQTNQFTALAEEFGKAVSESRTNYLRNAFNQKSLDPNAGLDAVDPRDPHALAEVLTGALYAVLVKDYERLEVLALAEGLEAIPARGKALGTAAWRFERFVFRALDYLPPGEATFADFVRAVLAADMAAYDQPHHEPYREVLRREALERHIVLSPAELDVEVNVAVQAIDDSPTSLEAIAQSDWYAHEWVSENRELVGIPDGAPFDLRPRLEVIRKYAGDAAVETVNELIIKVLWETTEPNPLGPWFPDLRDVTMGATLVIDRDQRLLRARLLTDRDPRHRLERDEFLLSLAEDDRIVSPADEPLGGADSQSYIVPTVRAGRMKLRGAARVLHIAADVWES